MATRREHVEPKTYFLNEAHELSPVEKSGGGRPVQYEGISWAAKGRKLTRSLNEVSENVEASADPLKEDRYFVLAAPVPETKKKSKDKKKAPDGTVCEKTDFGGLHGKVFDRLGLELLHVTDDGKAIVHAEHEQLEQLLQRTSSLKDLGPREQARWANIDSFETIPLQLRVDGEWLQSLHREEASDVVFELQPVLRRVEADRVLRVISDILTRRKGGRLTGSGTDFSGRHWFRGKATRSSVREIARDFYSVQSIHSPLFSVAAAGRPTPAIRSRATIPAPTVDPYQLPCVAVVDLGVPSDHQRLAKFRRGQYVPQDVAKPPVGDHGSFVASRVVFGDLDSDEQLAASSGLCAFYDAMVGEYPDGSGLADRVNDKAVMEAIRGVQGASPDVRVFNLSFGDSRPLGAFPEVERREKRLLLQDLDNFSFANDSVVVVAAGNSRPGVVPTSAYPNHKSDDQWALGPWACGFNTLVCGSYVSRLSTAGLVQNVGWPSPFSRIGPGLCGAPVPTFGAAGGDVTEDYNWSAGLGVWGYSSAGLPEDRPGTSFAAPLLAREAAFTLRELSKFCVAGTQPFAVLARAFMVLTARRSTNDDRVAELVSRTLGVGTASHDRLVVPQAGNAVILWQGVIESPDDKIRVQLPIPIGWLDEAKKPVLRLVICYDPPVNADAKEKWACRRVRAVLYLGPDASFRQAPRGEHGSYPLLVREYPLNPNKPGEKKAAIRDMWLLEMAYDNVFPYPPGAAFDPRQRVAFAAELFDADEDPVDPHPSMQALPIANSMIRLSVQPDAIRMPLIIRSRHS